ncbi:hypothetical protein JRO89_XSUnG0116500 [Xanthoceras sorbifolium]|uniref:Disease resistance RPP13-like protein 1 n=1 Tax=Xanthoceras sorbifolium TaxID=99658 RepID=A0ABQ8GYG0_9ROSI|nr:hypothetical protein JRO89_XSUnG0116500 [Xanthoceras sorbifolium]
MPIGEGFLSAFLQVLFDRLAPHNLSFLSRPDLVLELRKWRKNLLKIEAFLEDAEDKELAGDKLVKMWLDDLRDLACDLEDLLDDFATEEFENKLRAEHQSSSILEDAVKVFKSYTDMDGMKSKIDDISSRLDQLWEEKEDFGLMKKIAGEGTSSTAPAYRRPSTTSLQTETTVYGRDVDAAKILEMVLNTDESRDANLRVISIVGMGGIGKTTLAQKVFNDEAVKDFYPKAWTCVSDDFDVLRISKAILESITRSPCHLNGLDAVQNELKEAVAGKKFLLVLDDVWSKDYGLWESLRSPFKARAGGSKIIVTTRDVTVATTMGASTECHQLDILSDDECWSLFKAHAFEYRDIASYDNIELIHQKVIEKCRGLPLSVKTLSGLLRSKQREDEWLEVLNSKLWDLQDGSGIPASLKLSYYYLPAHLKRCFAHCAVLLKDYEFEEEELVLLWMAEGLIQPSKGKKQLEDLGHEYFCDLLSISLFQRSNNNESKFIMHDLVSDLARWASGGMCFHLEDMSEANEQPKSFEKVHHLSYASGEFDSERKFQVISGDDRVGQHLRTFLPLSLNKGFCSLSFITQTVIFDLLPKFKKLRMLSLEGYYVTELPDSFGNLRHLRFLNLSGTKIKSLPESTSFLLHLQILKLKDCYRLRKLPSKIKDLINLRYLDMRGVYLHAMPLGMNELRNLRYYLSNVIVGKGVGASFKDLKNLKLLGGELCILGLENVAYLSETREMMLKDKDLKELELKWGYQFDHSRDAVREKNVLDVLQPHRNLQSLTIEGYGGIEFPSWVGDSSFSKMTVLSLNCCENCKSLPPFGILSSLKDLTIRGMKELKFLGSEIYGVGCSKPFQSLETLYLEGLQKLEYWEPNEENMYVDAFSCLQELSIVNCPKISRRLPDRLPALEKLMIKNCEKLVVSSLSIPMLCELEIDGCKGLVCNSPVDFKSLKSMTLADISEFGNWLRQENFLQIESVQLKIMGCEQLKNLWQLNETFLQEPPQGLQSFISITKLRIENCSNLFPFPEVYFLFNLSELEIINCNPLDSLPDGMNCKNARLGSLKVAGCNSLTFIVRGQLPASLKRLEVKSCEKLEYLWDDKEKSYTSVVDEENSNNTSTSLLEYLEVRCCPSLKCLSSSGQLPEALQRLYVQQCSQLSMLSSAKLPKMLHALYINVVRNLESIAESFSSNSALEEIKIRSCENLKTVPEGLHNLYHLQKIDISDCERIECFAEEGLPSTKLSELGIEYCGKLKSLPNGFHSLNSLRILSLRRCQSMTSFPEAGFPTNLTSLSIYRDVKIYKPLLEWGLHNLTSLTSLRICGLPEAESFPQQEMEMTFPPSLTHLYIFEFPNLKCLMGEGFRNLSSLEELEIYFCPNFTSFPELALPSSLKTLKIDDCANFKYFSKIGLPSSISNLKIWECPEVKSFPEQGLPSSLLHLNIFDCPKLKEECKRDKGKEWSKISNIPRVEIDDRYIYDP